MGFERMADGQSLSAEFHLLRIFSVRGLVVRGIAKDPPQVFQGPSCRFAFGDTLNLLTQSLVGDSLVENEEEWCKENKANAPFLLVHVGPSPRGEISAGFAKLVGELTYTHDCFAPQREQLAATETQVIAPLIASLTLAFSGRSQPVQLLPVAREVFGKTAAGRTIAVFSIPARLTRTGVGFSREALDSAKSLAARFVWCSLLVWQDVSDDDIDRFRELKRERDRLSHGERTTVDVGLANRARDLCAMLVRAEIPFVRTTTSPSLALGGTVAPAP